MEAWSKQLGMFRINRNSPVPIYVQLVDRILTAINQQSIPLGSALPPEAIICKHIGISKMTLRHAYSILENKGYIEARQGRGTFVRSGRIKKQLPSMLSFSEEVVARGGKPSSRLLSLILSHAGDESQSFFGLAPNELVYEMRRLRYHDDLPLAVEVVQLPQKLFPGIDKFSWDTESLYKVMKSAYGVQLSRCDSEILAAPATREQANLLNLNVASPLIVINRRSYSVKDVPVEYSVTCYPGNSYSVTFTAIRKS
jgi:GntR family transcriptional regulator